MYRKNEEKIEKARAKLNAAYAANAGQEIILKLSRKLDEYIAEAYRLNLDLIKKTS